jgi:transposase InsO family protein
LSGGVLYLPHALLHHSDRGSQYTSEQFQRLMGRQRRHLFDESVRQRWDNAAMESSFSSREPDVLIPFGALGGVMVGAVFYVVAVGVIDMR